MRHRRRARASTERLPRHRASTSTRMREQLAHRGPDGGDTWVDDDGRIGLGFRRLAIIDLSDAAMQPMANEDGSVRLVFNGEIYNHARDPQPSSRRSAATRSATDHSDTEVIVHAFEQWGIDCLHRFRGMFALAIWDARTQRALARPRPHRDQAALLLASTTAGSSSRSEIKALLAGSRAGARGRRGGALPLPLVPDDAGAADALHGDQEAARRHVAADRARTATIREQRYWDVWDHVEPLDRRARRRDRRAAARRAAHVGAAAARSATSRSASSSPAGSTRARTRRSSPRARATPVKTFSIGYEGEYETYKNELHYARQMAERDRRRASRAAADAWTTSSTSCRRWCGSRTSRSPTRSASPSTTSRSSRATTASSSRQVGEGADELFWGYPSWKTLPQPAALRRPAGARGC